MAENKVQDYTDDRKDGVDDILPHPIIANHPITIDRFFIPPPRYF